MKSRCDVFIGRCWWMSLSVFWVAELVKWGRWGNGDWNRNVQMNGCELISYSLAIGGKFVDKEIWDSTAQFLIIYVSELCVWSWLCNCSFAMQHCLRASPADSANLLSMYSRVSLLHVYLIAHSMVTVFTVLPLPVLVCGTVCRCTFQNRTFHSTDFVLGGGDRSALWLIVKSAIYKYVTYLLISKVTSLPPTLTVSLLCQVIEFFA